MALNCELCQLDRHDIDALIHLSASVGWDYDAAELNTLLTVGRMFGHKTSAGNLVSSAAIVPYAPTFAFLGMVIVHPAYRRQGLGEAVTAAARDAMPADSCVALVSTPEGRGLYENMGFEEVTKVHKYVRSRIEAGSKSNLRAHSAVALQAMRTEDLPRIAELDVLAFGVDRQAFLRQRWQQSATSWIVTDDTNVMGYALAIKGHVNWILGPLVARDDHYASQLAAQIVASTTDAMRIDVPSQHAEWATDELVCRGFVKVAEPPIMTYRGRPLPTRQGLYALAAQVFG